MPRSLIRWPPIGNLFLGRYRFSDRSNAAQHRKPVRLFRLRPFRLGKSGGVAGRSDRHFATNTNGTPDDGDNARHERPSPPHRSGDGLQAAVTIVAMTGAATIGPAMTVMLRLALAACLAVILAAIMLPGDAIAVGALFVPPASGNIGTGKYGGSAGKRADPVSGAPWQQVRIEQHLIIRITPGNATVLRDLPLPETEPLPTRLKDQGLKERRMPPCVPVAAIAGVRPLAGDRLLLIMRDHRLVGADLSRSCAARDFYMGFYLNPTPDGMLCKNRDTIHSRAGTTCTITRVHALVPVN